MKWAFLEGHKLLKLTQELTDNLNSIHLLKQDLPKLAL